MGAEGPPCPLVIGRPFKDGQRIEPDWAALEELTMQKHDVSTSRLPFSGRCGV